MTARELSFAERRNWLRLIRTPSVGPVSFRDLLARYKTASAALEALPQIIRRASVSIPSVEVIEAELDAAVNMGVKYIFACEPDFPEYLRALNPPPPYIAVWGNTEILNTPSIAIVGSRNASAIGQRFARQISSELGQAGYVIVSGLARGIDANAHEGGLDTGTVAVLGGGIDHIYPRQNTELYHAIRERGALVSESPIGYKATARDFPRRNRIISGLCLGIVVIEAAERSGTLITARYALEQNREVMAAPGSPLDPRTKGCNRLIQQGAALIESASDVIDIVENLPQPYVHEPDNDFRAGEFDWQAAEKDIDRAKTNLTSLLSPTPTPRDEIIRLSDMPVPICTAALLELELNGDIIVEPDGRVSLNLTL